MTIKKKKTHILIETKDAFWVIWPQLDLWKEDRFMIHFHIDRVKKWKSKKPEIPAKIKQIAEERAALRAAKKFDEADAMREQINNLGWRIEDLPDGYRLF